MGNLRVKKKRGLSPFRKIALGTWRNATDPQVYGSLTVNMKDTLRYIELFREKTGKRLTVTHVMAKVVGAVLDEMPDANAILRFGRIYVRQDIAVFFQVAMKDPETGEIDLSGVTIRDPEKKSLAEICDEFMVRAEKVRQRKDKELEQTRGTFGMMPQFLVRFMLGVVHVLSYGMNLNLKWLGIPQDAFGSAMVTNIGSLGLEEAYVPLVPYSHVPLLLAMGAVNDVPVVEDGQIVPGKTMKLFATFDHRVLDGAHAAKMVSIVKRWLENPFDHFDKLDDAPALAAASEPAEAEATAGA